MKRCPQCGREYDNTMMFCLDDGSELLYGPASMDEPATAILHSTAAPGEAPTRAQINTTDATAILRTGAEAEPLRKVGSKQRQLAVLAVTVLILAVGGFFGYRYINSTNAEQINSIAVLPFENRSANADTEYLSDGLADSLIYRLSQLPNLKVSPTSSVMRYKGSATDVAQIAKELEVDAIMSGRLTQRGDDLSISVQLIDSRTKKLIWAEQYDRKMADLLVTQREMASTITQKLQLKLSGESEQKLAKKYTDNNEAYQLYLQGRYHWNKREAKELEKAIVFFKQAIEKDPNYALAYSGLADTLNLFPNNGDFRPKDYRPQAKQAALRALELDPNLAEAHTSLAKILFDYEYDFEGAEKSFKRAIELDPNYASARQWYSELLSVSNRNDEATKEITKGLELDPFSLVINNWMAIHLYRLGRYDEALLQTKKVSELFPNSTFFHSLNSSIYAAQGKYDQAVEEFLLAAKANKDFKPENIAKLKSAYEKGGWDGFQRIRQEIRLEELNAKQAEDPNGYVKAMNYAIAYSLGKDKDKTIEYLNKAYDERDERMLDLKVTKTWDFVRDDPRFKELVKRVGIPE
ncbi:MAG: hypothetical protein IPI64_01680 [Chloracidobacterium sp.]|nr:hypothetical protein [Chloracidobacterium sp.]